MIHSFSVRSGSKETMLNITRQVESFIKSTEVQEGIVVVYSTHTTAGILINENADPDLKHDLYKRLSEISPWNHASDKHAEGNTAAHLKAIMVGNSQTIPIHNGTLQLGRWQGIYFCEFDGPRERTIIIKVIAG